MVTYLLAVGIVLLILLGWVAVQQMARLFAAKHPEFGPYTEKVGCGGGGCGCGGKSCSTPDADDKWTGNIRTKSGEPARDNPAIDQLND